MSINRNKKLKKGVLSGSDGFKPQIDLFFGKASHLLLLYFKFFINFLNVAVQFSIRLYFFKLVIHSFEFNFKSPLLVVNVECVFLFRELLEEVPFVLVDSNYRKVFKICPAFHDC